MSIFISEFLLGGSGKRVAIKDSIDIAGHATQSGSRAFAHALPALRNAEVVDAILAAGWQIVGKTNLHELAFGVTGINDLTGTPINPQAPDRVPGGSSSGSAAAVAAGLAD
ncbi:amidase family protein, partial [Pseudomonas sp. TNT3]